MCASCPADLTSFACVCDLEHLQIFDSEVSSVDMLRSFESAIAVLS